MQQESTRPRLIDAPPEGAAGQALVEADGPAGMVVLSSPAGDVALVWSADDRDRRRALPPGEYRLRTTRVERALEGVHWFLSASGPPGEPRRFEVGEPTKLELGGEVRFKARARRMPEKLQLGFAITSADGRGLSIYRDGRRVPVTYQVLDAQGDVLAEGTAKYG